MKNRSFVERLGFALAGLSLVFRREKSFRTQVLIACAVSAAMIAFRPGLLWAAVAAFAIALVLALELINSALEYILDRLHPAYSREIGAAKDAAAAAVLLASLGASAIGTLMLLSMLGT